MIESKLVKIKKLHKDAIIPKYQTIGSAGFDLSSIIDCKLFPNQQELIPTGLSVEIPLGTELQIRPRSGLAKNSMISITNSPGTLDSDYRGPIGIILINHSPFVFEIKKGDRVAQAVLCPVYQANFEVVDELSNTDRGENGYGSTGK
jgi:dUTP pyrophosphatase